MRRRARSGRPSRVAQVPRPRLQPQTDREPVSGQHGVMSYSTLPSPKRRRCVPETPRRLEEAREAAKVPQPGILSVLPTRCVTLGKSLPLSGPRFIHL